MHAAAAPPTAAHYEAVARAEPVAPLPPMAQPQAPAWQETVTYAAVAREYEAPAPPRTDTVAVAQTSVGYAEATRHQEPSSYAKSTAVEPPIDDDLTLPDADELFGRRREFVPEQVEDDFGAGEEFEIDLDAAEPATPAVAPPQIPTPPPLVETPTVHAVAPPFMAAPPPPVVEAPQPVAQVFEPIAQPAAQIPEPVAAMPVPTPGVEA